MAYLRGRGFTDEAIRAARLGLVQNLMVPKSDGTGSFALSGISIPWFDGDRLAKINVRRFGNVAKGRRYMQVFQDRPSLYAPFGVRYGWPLIVCEGELDALLLAQELGRVASVATLGSASGEPSPEALRAIRRAPRLFIATDADPAGERAATLWPSWAVRVSPEGGKDWGEVHVRDPLAILRAWPEHLPTLKAELLAEAEWEAKAERLAIMRADGIEGEPEPSLSPARWLAELNRLKGERPNATKSTMSTPPTEAWSGDN